RTQRGHHKPWILLAVDVLGLGDHTSRSVPAAGFPFLGLPLLGLVAELRKYTRRLAALLPLLGRFPHLRPNDPPQPLVARQPEHVIHAVGFAPAHQLIAAET